MATKKPARKSRAGRQRKPQLSADQRRASKIKRDHTRLVRTVFANLGFDRVSEVSDKEITFNGCVGDFDDLFILENVIVLAEYTISQESNVGDHLKKKKFIFSQVAADPKAFINYLLGKFSTFSERLGAGFHIDQYQLRIIYCSRNQVDRTHKSLVSEAVYLDFPVLKYFEMLTSVIKISALNEMLNFLGLKYPDVAKNGIFPSAHAAVAYSGSILAESSSGFPAGYKVVSFYVDAAALLERAYVLRRDGWRGSQAAYQRMVQKKKIEAIRKKLKTDRKVFINNIIVTLPEDVKPENDRGETIDISKLTQTAEVRFRLPQRANSICLIDGQHRLYSYYETKEDDPEIARMRRNQNLLVTGVIYPQNTLQEKKDEFEASLFLAINTTQTNASTALRQEIEVALSGVSPTAIARRVMVELAQEKPLFGHVQRFFYEKGKLKTTSIVSYGLAPLIKLSGEDSLFKLFSHPEKEKIASGESAAGLPAYIQFSVSAIRGFLNAVQCNVEPARWTSDPKVTGRLLTVTYINSFLITLRRLVGAGKSIEFDALNLALKDIKGFNFNQYHSSQYGRMADDIYSAHFECQKRQP